MWYWKEKGTAPLSYVATHLETLAREGIASEEHIEDIKGTAGTIYGSMSWFLTCTHNAFITSQSQPGWRLLVFVILYAIHRDIDGPPH
jgi:hypothetical protein